MTNNYSIHRVKSHKYYIAYYDNQKHQYIVSCRSGYNYGHTPSAAYNAGYNPTTYRTRKEAEQRIQETY